MVEKERPITNTSEEVEELAPIKVKKSTYRLIKTTAAWLGITAIEYLDRITKEAVARDLATLSEEVQDKLGTKRKK